MENIRQQLKAAMSSPLRRFGLMVVCLLGVTVLSAVFLLVYKIATSF